MLKRMHFVKHKHTGKHPDYPLYYDLYHCYVDGIWDGDKSTYKEVLKKYPTNCWERIEVEDISCAMNRLVKDKGDLPLIDWR